MAQALGGRSVHVHPAFLRARRWVLARYLLSVVLTSAALLRHRPRAVVVTNPPVVPGLVVAAYAALSRAPFLLDSHTSSFGVKGNEVARRSLGVTRWLARRSAGVMVTTESWVREVEGWGARGLVVHEAPPSWDLAPRGPRTGRPQVLFVGVFSDDEPVEEVVAAAAMLPEADLLVTGDVTRAPSRLVESLPANVRLVGFLDRPSYAAVLESADVVVALTTEPTSVMRAAYEAVYASRPLVVTDWPTLREVFPLARHSDNEPAALAAAIGAALSEDPGAAAERAADAVRLQRGRWHGQLAAMRRALSMPGA